MPAAFIQANTNGRLHSAHEPSLSPLNRGYLYGDAIYEVWRTYEGVIFGWIEHLDRLEASARALHMTLPWSRAHLLAEIQRTVAAFRTATGFRDDVYIRIQVSRGGGPIGLDTALADAPEFVLLVQPCPLLSAQQVTTGIKLSIATELRRNPIEALSPAWKTGNYLNNILCLREARARGADDVLMLNLRGEVTEAATSNVVFIRDGEAFTPPLSVGILSGITRGLLLSKVAAAAGVRMHEAVWHPADMAGAQECFVIASTRDVVPVGSIDDLRFKVGPDTVSMRLKQAFADNARDWAQAHPELRA